MKKSIILKILKISVFGLLAGMLFAGFPPPAAFAQEGTAPSSVFAIDGVKLAQAETEKAPAAKTAPSKSIPDSFSVGKFLQLKDQKDRVPDAKAGAKNEGRGIMQVFLDGIDLFIKLIASVALMVFIIGALLTVASEGKQDRLEKGKNAMVYSLTGLVISLMAFIIVQFVQSILF